MNVAIQEPQLDSANPIPLHLRPDLKARGMELSYNQSDYVYQIGSPANSVFFVLSGRFKVGSSNAEGKVYAHSILLEGDLFGELALFGQEQRIEFVEAVDGGSSVLRISINVLKEVIREDIEFQLFFNESIVTKMSYLQQRIEFLMHADARTRIVGFIRNLAVRKGQKVGFETVIRKHLKHRDIAEISGTSRQTVTTVLNELREKNIISFNRRQILIRSLDELI